MIFFFPYNPHPHPHPDKPPRPSHPRGLDFGPFRLCLAPFRVRLAPFGSVSGPFRVRFGVLGGLRGPAAILFISRDTCSDSIAKLFHACLLWGIAQLSRDM